MYFNYYGVFKQAITKHWDLHITYVVNDTRLGHSSAFEKRLISSVFLSLLHHTTYLNAPW